MILAAKPDEPATAILTTFRAGPSSALPGHRAKIMVYHPAAWMQYQSGMTRSLGAHAKPPKAV